MARFPGTRLAIASQSVNWPLDKLGLAPSAIARPDDVEDLVNAIVEAESSAQDEPSAAPPPWQFQNTQVLQPVSA